MVSRAERSGEHASDSCEELGRFNTHAHPAKDLIGSFEGDRRRAAGTGRPHLMFEQYGMFSQLGPWCLTIRSQPGHANGACGLAETAITSNKEGCNLDVQRCREVNLSTSRRPYGPAQCYHHCSLMRPSHLTRAQEYGLSHVDDPREYPILLQPSDSTAYTSRKREHLHGDQPTKILTYKVHSSTRPTASPTAPSKKRHKARLARPASKGRRVAACSRVQPERGPAPIPCAT